MPPSVCRAAGANVSPTSHEHGAGAVWEPPALLHHTTDSPPRFKPKAKTVLVVDDKEGVRTSVAAVLRSEGYTVTLSTNGQDALPLLRRGCFDALVLDLRMPLVGGARLLAAVSKPPPTVILSATELASDERSRIGPVVVAELTKPVAPQRLLDAVALAVEGRASLIRER